MGCDIHSYVEVKQDDGRWHAPRCFESDHRIDPRMREIFNDPDMVTEAPSPIDNRNYELFSFLADVRNYNEEITPALVWLTPTPITTYTRGIPDGLSDFVHKEYFDGWDSDAHSESWFTLEELKVALAAARIAGQSEGFGESLQWSLDQIEERTAPAKAQDVRIVFWFDN